MSTLKIFHKKKILLVFLLCAAMLVGLVGRLGYLMLFQSEYYHRNRTDRLIVRQHRAVDIQNPPSGRLDIPFPLVKVRSLFVVIF